MARFFVRFSPYLIIGILLPGCRNDSGTITQPVNHSTPSTEQHQPNQVVFFETSGPAPLRHNQDRRQVLPTDWFDDIAVDSDIVFTYRNGREGLKYTILETIGGGAALIDIDNDDRLELFITAGGTVEGSPMVTGGLPCGLFRDRGGLKYVDIASSAGVLTSSSYTLACSACDYNCDGFADLFVTGFPHCHLYRNCGDGTFQNVTEFAGLVFDRLHAASSWGDYDNDGFPDLYITGYVQFDLKEDRNCLDRLRHIPETCGVWKYPPARDDLFRNLGDGTFSQMNETAGLRVDGKGLGAFWADINVDGHLDLYVANDATPNFLYLGDGRGHFTECGLISGTAYDEKGAPQGSMGVDWGDYDGDGFGDIFVTNYELEDNTLYRHLGDANFEVATTRVGLQNRCRPNVGFGTGWVDWDNDGWLDLFVLNGHVMYYTGQSPYEQPAFLFRNIDGRRFENVSSQGGPYFAGLHVGRGGVVGDLDNDGAPDLVAVHQNSPVSVLRNRKHQTRWYCVLLHGTESEPFAAGAVITSNFAGRRLVRYARGGGGYFSHFDRRIYFPVDDVEHIECTVRWLSGRTETFRNLRLGQTNPLIECRGEQ